MGYGKRVHPYRSFLDIVEYGMNRGGFFLPGGEIRLSGVYQEKHEWRNRHTNQRDVQKDYGREGPSTSATSHH